MEWLKRLWWRILPPIEVSSTKDFVDAFLKDCGHTTSSTLKNIVYLKINDVEKTIYTIRCLHKTPEYLALLLINNVSGELLQSGGYHTYRGALSFQGQELLTVFKSSVKLLETKNYYTAEEALEDLAWIRREIKDIG